MTEFFLIPYHHNSISPSTPASGCIIYYNGSQNSQETFAYISCFIRNDIKKDEVNSQRRRDVDGVSSRRVLSEGGPVRWRWGAPPPGTWMHSPESSPNLLAEGVL